MSPQSLKLRSRHQKFLNKRQGLMMSQKIRITISKPPMLSKLLCNLLIILRQVLRLRKKPRTSSNQQQQLLPRKNQIQWLKLYHNQMHRWTLKLINLMIPLSEKREISPSLQY